MGMVDIAGGAVLELSALGFLTYGLGASCFEAAGFNSGLSCGTGWLFLIVGIALLAAGIGIQVLQPSETG
jgi:hypothetical protein